MVGCVRGVTEEMEHTASSGVRKNKILSQKEGAGQPCRGTLRHPILTQTRE